MAGDVLPFNPLDKRHLGESVAQALLREPVRQLETITKFEGAGIYALYYMGNFAAYRGIAASSLSRDTAIPIYVGKAVPKGARKGNELNAPPGIALFSRLLEHRSSIVDAKNLDVADFQCRYLLVDDIWIPLGETLLISTYVPIWNKLIDGFGNHDPGKGRHAGLRPRWDVLHPGRSWADKCKARDETAEQIEREVQEHLRRILPAAH